MELTQEYFDKGLTNLLEKVASKGDIAAIRTEMATKDDIADLRTYIHEGMEIQQQWMDERFKELITVYDVRDRVIKLEAGI